MATFDEQRRKAFDFCADATKQLVALSSAIVAFMVTFAKDFVMNVADDAKTYAYIAWGLHVVSIVLGVLVLLALTAQLEPKNSPASSPAAIPTIRGSAATYSWLQIVFFVLAMAVTAFFGWQAAHAPPPFASKDVVLEKKLDELRAEVDKLKSELGTITQTQAAAQGDVHRQLAELTSKVQKLREELKPQKVRSTQKAPAGRPR